MADTGGRGGHPGAAGSEAEFTYRGNRFGLPESGPRSVPGFGRRFGALLFDWLLSVGAASALADSLGADTGTTALLVFAVQNVVLLTLFGTTIGRRLFGIGLAATGERALAWPVAMLVRTLLLCLVVPAVIYDRDQRGLHDRVAGTVSARLG